MIKCLRCKNYAKYPGMSKGEVPEYLKCPLCNGTGEIAEGKYKECEECKDLHGYKKNETKDKRYFCDACSGKAYSLE